MEININGNKIVFFDDIETLSMKRYALFNKYILLDSGIGSDLEAVNSHMTKLYLYLKDKEQENLRNELINLHQNLTFAISELSPKTRAFACLVKSINGKEYKEISEAILDSIIKRLEQKTPMYKVSELVEVLKKKLILKLKYFSKVQVQT